MTIQTEDRKAGPFTGDGVTVNFDFGFKVFSETDVLVIQAVTATGAETEKTITTDYTVTLNPNQESSPGGRVTMLVAPPAGQTITLTSEVPNLQAKNITSLGGFFPQVLNDALDRLTVLVQQVRRDVARSVKVNLSSTTTPDQLLSDINNSVIAADASAVAAAASAAAADASADAAAGSAADAANDLSLAEAMLLAAKLGAGANIASASTLPLAARTGNLVRITGTVPVTATDLENGGQVWAIPVGALPLIYNASTMPLQGGQSYTCAPDDLLFFSRDGSGVLKVLIFSKTTLLSALGVRFSSGNLVGVASSIPTTGSYKDGDVVIEISASVIGVSGWKRLTTGSAHVLGTDWKYFGGIKSMVRVNGPNGFGSTNTGVRRFSTVVVNQGNDITYADSAANGASFTINTPGTYSISYSDAFSAAADFVISLNATTPVTSIPGTLSQILAESTTANVAQRSTASVSVYLQAGDVIRPATGGSGSSRAFMTVTRVD